jgi:carboxypeptidase family protein
MMRRTIASVTVLCLALLAPRPVLADRQHQGRSTLTGVVLGPDDKPVSHASVTYQSSSGTGAHAIYTNSKGRFTITKLQADNYDLRASSKGVFSEWEKNVTLGRGQTREITLQLIYARELPKTPQASKPNQ